jgi:alpha-ketoglutarate-dependent taurine dioxygenase
MAISPFISAPESRKFAETFGTVLEGRSTPLRAIKRDDLIATFKATGVVVLRGFGAKLDDFVWLTENLCHDFSTYRGGGFRWGPLNRDAIGNNPTLMTVTGSGQGWPIPLHGEMYYMKQRPTMLWFYCEQAPEQGGQTTVCDGEAALAALSPDTRGWLRQHNIKYVRDLTREEWPVTFQTDDADELAAICALNELQLTVHDDGSIVTEFVCPPIVCPRGSDREALVNSIVQMYTTEWAFESGWIKKNMPQLPRDRSPMVVRTEDGAKIPSEIFEELKRVLESLTVNVDWETGDILLIDNTRVLHGRRQAGDSKRNILVRMGEPAFAW